MGAFHTFTSTLGASLVLYASYKLLDAAQLYLRPSGLHRYLYTDASGQHAWALVTGSNNGIGRGLAFELASHGFNVVLHGRNPRKLEAVRDELQATYPHAEVRILLADASQCHRPEAVDFEGIKEELASLHLTVLINCAGAGPTPTFGALETYGRDVILDNIYLNAAFPTLLTAALLPVLRGQYKKPAENVSNGDARESSSRWPRSRPALILNIGSVTDDGFPLVSFYSAGKAASHVLHKAIAREAALEGWHDVEIVSHRIGAVTGVSHTQAPPTLLRPEARTIARAVLARTGCGRKSVVPYWPHALLQVFLGLLPVSVVDRIVNNAMRRVELEEARKKE